MAFFKSLKNSFNQIYIDGVLSVTKKIKLTSYRFVWKIISGLTPVKKDIYGLLIFSYVLGNGVLNFFPGDNRFYAWTGRAWSRKTDLPVSLTDQAYHRGHILSLYTRLYFIPTGNGNLKMYKYEEGTSYGATNGQWLDNHTDIPHPMFGAAVAATDSGLVVWHFIGGGVSTYHKRHYVFNQSEWIQYNDVPKDLCSDATGAYAGTGATAIFVEGKLHYIGYSQSDNFIYDYVWKPSNDTWESPVTINTRHASRVLGSFTDDQHDYYYFYTETRLFKWNNDTDVWEEISANDPLGNYTRDSVAFFRASNFLDVRHKSYRILNNNMYELKPAYKLDYED